MLVYLISKTFQCDIFYSQHCACLLFPKFLIKPTLEKQNLFQMYVSDLFQTNWSLKVQVGTNAEILSLNEQNFYNLGFTCKLDIS